MAEHQETTAPLVLVINGPNLNLLGAREPNLYGDNTLAAIEARVMARAREVGIRIESHQSNHEGALVDIIQSAKGRAGGIILNPGAYTHTPVAIRDAISAVCLPSVEVHITNVHAREGFRRRSYLSPIVTAVIAGAGSQGYLLALDFLATNLESRVPSLEVQPA